VLVYADDVNLLGDNIDAIKKNWTVQYWGRDGTMGHTCHYISWHRNFSFYQDYKLSVIE
jgi:hypothetical protein